MPDKKDIVKVTSSNALDSSIDNMLSRLPSEQQVAIVQKALEAKVALSIGEAKTGQTLDTISALIQNTEQTIESQITTKGTFETGTGKIEVTIKKKGRFF